MKKELILILEEPNHFQNLKKMINLFKIVMEEDIPSEMGLINIKMGIDMEKGKVMEEINKEEEVNLRIQELYLLETYL